MAALAALPFIYWLATRNQPKTIECYISDAKLKLTFKVHGNGKVEVFYGGNRLKPLDQGARWATFRGSCADIGVMVRAADIHVPPNGRIRATRRTSAS